jgi:phage repressor protein C with HTH and peptisase S24 domain
MDMRETLRALMQHHGDSEYTLEEKSGVPQPTTHRFLKGQNKTANEGTVAKWAAAYKVSVSQLRGDMPIPYLTDTTFNFDSSSDDDRLSSPMFSRGVSEMSPAPYVPEKKKGLLSKVSELIGAGGEAFVQVSLMSTKASMGGGNEVMDDEVVVDMLRISKHWLDRTLLNISHVRNLAFIHGIGDSMSPTFSDGDILLVDTGITDVFVDGVYVLEAHNRLFIKRVRQRIDGNHEISSDNPTVKTVDILNGDHEVTIRGRVVWVWNGRRL